MTSSENSFLLIQFIAILLYVHQHLVQGLTTKLNVMESMTLHSTFETIYYKDAPLINLTLYGHHDIKTVLENIPQIHQQLQNWTSYYLLICCGAYQAGLWIDGIYIFKIKSQQ